MLVDHAQAEHAIERYDEFWKIHCQMVLIDNSAIAAPNIIFLVIANLCLKNLSDEVCS